MTSESKSRKVFVLNPIQSRKLIAKGVLALPQVQYALMEQKIFIGRGSTNAFIVEECLKQLNITEEFKKGDYVAGQIVPGEKLMRWGINKGNASPELIFDKQQKIEVEDRVKAVLKFKQGDIIIKGGNALDLNGVPGVLIGSPKDGGTIGSIQSTIQAKGLEVICPIGLEKLVNCDLMEVQTLMGVYNMDHPAEGMKCGIIPMPYATVVTEIEALEALFDCDAFHVSSGGVGGAEGSVGILVDAYDEEEIEKITKLMNEIAEATFSPNL